MGLKEGLKAIFNRIKNAVFLDKAELDGIIKELEKTMLASDVDVSLVMNLSQEIKRRALREDLKTLEKKELLTKFIYDEIIKILGEKNYELKLEKGSKVLLIGLYGCGKTTTTVKLANFYSKQGFKTCVVGLDVHRPAAQEQLEQLARKNNIKAFVSKESDPIKIWKNYENEIKKFDIAFIDSAGRDALDENLIKEIKNIYNFILPTYVLLIIPADIGQIAKKQAEFFSKAIKIDGIVLTRMDGTAKAGGALASCKQANAKVYFIGVGEKINDIERFDPKQYVSRLLGLGDLQSLLEKIRITLGEKEKKAIVSEDKFTLLNFYEQICAMQKLGSFKKLLDFIPGLSNMNIPSGLIDIQEKKLKQWKAAIDSMTKLERESPEIITGSRLSRISKGSHVPISEIKELLRQYKLVKEFSTGISEKKISKLAKRFGLNF
ncbi:MAG: signal recognition particle receptor subunit alpha [Candidatus Omnitrophica bacterium]|nr:signal recognition particle receptor subunit alpha [Candidatus Omnitrophota bacterium]